ncbi:MAG TPA: PHP domain-containing protein, partial [Polyangiales bacterium]|nr:PHP domain-containing protein [Polyangiales bacterium]
MGALWLVVAPAVTYANEAALTAGVVSRLATSAAATREAEERAPEFVPFGPLSIGGVEYFTYRFEGHVHTAYSPDAKHRVGEVLSAAERAGLDALVITDHGGSQALRDFADYHGKLVPFVGREIGGQFGHALFWNVVEDAFHPPSTTTLSQRARFAHEHSGLLIFAHPGWWIDGNGQDPMQWMTPQAMRRGGIAGDVDAIELWNG